ncbi:MAG TPA: hypothetical protein VGL39_28480 [Jatrophihabitantaceae bacterium]|jgi:hypothetical protein
MVAAAAAVSVLALAVVANAPAAHADAAGQGGNYVALAQEGNLMDTRSGTGVPKAKVGAGGSVTFQATGVGGVPSTGVSAVLIDFTAISPTATTYLRINASGASGGGTSELNIAASSAPLSNSATVAVGSDGKLTVYNSAGTVDVRVDVQGYFTSTNGASGPGGFVPVPYTGLVDTRSGVGAPKAKIAANGSLTVTLTGGVIPADADSVYLDLVVFSTAAGWIGRYPAGGTVATTSVLDFLSGTTSSGVTAKLGPSGKVTFVNRSSAAIDLALEAEGYTSPAVTAGAGYRAVQARLTAVKLAANATTDVQVGGRNGLPTRGIAGAAISFAVSGATAAGHLHAWGVGASEVGSLLFFGTSTRASFAVVQPGTDTKIRVRNLSTGTITLYVDLLGWFADPIPSVPLQDDAPISVIQAPAPASGGPGALEYAYVDGFGQIHAGHQQNLDDTTSVQWATISFIDDQFSDRPSIVALPDKSIQVAAQNTDSNIWSQSAAAPPTWPTTPYARLGGSMAAPPVSGTLPDNNVVLFAVDADGRLWVRPQSGTAQYWQSVGLAGLVGTPAVVHTSTGVRLFARTSAGTVTTATYVGGALSAWTDLGGSGVVSDPAAAVAPGALARVVITQGDGSVVIKAQASDGSFPSGWTSIGSPGAFTAKGSPAIAFSPQTTSFTVVARGQDDFIWESDQTGSASGAFGEWVSQSQFPSGTDPVMTAVEGSANVFWAATYRTSAGTPHLLVNGILTSPASASNHSAPTSVDRQLNRPPTS